MSLKLKIIFDPYSYKGIKCICLEEEVEGLKNLMEKYYLDLSNSKIIERDSEEQTNLFIIDVPFITYSSYMSAIVSGNLDNFLDNES